jgi:PadR family transcriptional regulator, regulatory protein PadR
MRRTKAVDKFLTKFDKELKSGMISLILLYMIDHANESMYGYQIIRVIKERTGGSLDFKEGTIYPILRNLEAQGLLQSAWDTRGERPRKYYHITADGTSALREAVRDWTTFSGIIGALLMGEAPGGAGGNEQETGDDEEELVQIDPILEDIREIVKGGKRRPARGDGS